MKKKVLISLLIVLVLASLAWAETETPIGTFTVSNVAPEAPHSWDPLTTHNKSQIFTWTEGYDANDDPVSTYLCITNDTDSDTCSVVNSGLLADPSYAFTQSESFWDYLWGVASRTYYVKLTPNDGTVNGTFNDTISFTLTNALPTTSGQTSDSSSKGDKDVGQEITFSLSHHDDDAEDLHNLRVCKTDAISTDGTCTGGEYCNKHNDTYSTDANLECGYVAQQGDGTSNTAYFFVCDCPPDDLTCPGQCSASASHTFYVNHAPTASNMDVTPDSPTSAQDLYCSYSFADSDGDSEGASTFRWYNWSGSDWEYSGITTQTLDASNTRFNEVWMCGVTPVDEHSFAGIEFNSTNETIGNNPPDQPANFMVQDGASSWDSTAPIDTHDLTPNLNWSTSDNDGDPVTTYVCIATTSENRDAGNCDAYSSSTGTDSVDDVTGLAYSGTSRTYYVRLTPNDGSENGTALDVQFNLINSIPDLPSGLSPTDTHNPLPILSWTATDPDDGSDNHWPADTLTYHIRVGTSYGDGTYLSSDDADKNGEQVTSQIPWGIPGEVWANNTVYVQIWTTDGNGGTSDTYNTTLNLYDYLPDITNIEMTDVGSSYSSCTSAACAINPIEHSNASVAVRITTTDTDEDCDVGDGSKTTIHLCLDTGSCTPPGDYSWEVDSVSRSGSTCTYVFSANKTAADGTPEFFRLPSSEYKLYVNATSQAGQRTADAERTADWTYGTLKAINYPSTVTLGDGTPALGQWNNGTVLAAMTNWGNAVLNIQWQSTNPTSGEGTWILNGTDMQIDDDPAYDDETSGYLSPVFINGTAAAFQPGTGLEVCSSASCDDPALNQTLNTYFHISPPFGLKAGVYNSTITITIS